MHQRNHQLTIAAVTFILGLLVIVQLRTQAHRTPGFLPASPIAWIAPSAMSSLCA